MTAFKKSVSIILAAIMLLGVLLVAPISASADSDTFTLKSPVKNQKYILGEPVKIEIKKESFYRAYSKNGSDQGNIYITLEIRKGDIYVTSYVTEISPDNVGTVYTDSFTPEYTGRYTVLVQERRVSFGIASKRVDDESKKFTFDVVEENGMSVIACSRTVKAKDLKKSKKIVKPLIIQFAKGTVKVVKVKSGTSSKIYKKIKVNKKNGAITFNKGKYKKGTYKVKLKITASGDSKYISKTITKTVKIKIK